MYSLLLFLVPYESNFVLLVSQTLVQQKHNKHGYPDDREGGGNILTAAADHDAAAVAVFAHFYEAVTAPHADGIDSATVLIPPPPSILLIPRLILISLQPPVPLPLPTIMQPGRWFRRHVTVVVAVDPSTIACARLFPRLFR